MKEEAFAYICQLAKNEIALEWDDAIIMSTTLHQAGVDSIGLMTIIIYLEERYHCEIDLSNKDAANYMNLTFEDIINLLPGMQENVYK